MLISSIFLNFSDAVNKDTRSNLHPNGLQPRRVEIRTAEVQTKAEMSFSLRPYLEAAVSHVFICYTACNMIAV